MELRHKLTFFLVTAAVAPLGYTLSTAISKNAVALGGLPALAFLASGGIAALVAAAFALSSLKNEIRSFQLHLKYRYQRKRFNELTSAEVAKWDVINASARKHVNFAFVLVISAVALQALFFATYLTKQEVSVHHYGEDSLEVVSTQAAHQLSFVNKVTGTRIVMLIPRSGAREDGEDLRDDQAQDLARKVTHLLRESL